MGRANTETETRSVAIEALWPRDGCLLSWLERNDGRTRSSLVSAYVRELWSSTAIVKCLMPHEAAKIIDPVKVLRQNYVFFTKTVRDGLPTLTNWGRL